MNKKYKDINTGKIKTYEEIKEYYNNNKEIKESFDNVKDLIKQFYKEI